MVKSSIQKGTRVAQSATGDLMAEMFTLQEAERVQEEGFDDVNIYGGGGGGDTFLVKGGISRYYHLKRDYQ